MKVGRVPALLLQCLELGLELKRRRMRERIGIALATTDKVREAIREVLPFHPTAATLRRGGPPQALEPPRPVSWQAPPCREGRANGYSVRPFRAIELPTVQRQKEEVFGVFLALSNAQPPKVAGATGIVLMESRVR